MTRMVVLAAMTFACVQRGKWVMPVPEKDRPPALYLTFAGATSTGFTAHSPQSLNAIDGRVYFSDFGVFKSAERFQYSSETKRSISDSRSQTSRSDTDWTRPAERAPGSLRHSTGDRLKPTR